MNNVSPNLKSDQSEYIEHSVQKFKMVQVFYGTDRMLGKLRTDAFYGNQRGTLAFGVCRVSIPEHHRMGELEAPSWQKFEFHENPKKHIVLLEVTPQSEKKFIAGLRLYIHRSEENQAFVFVHGYNVSFEDAARRTAQMAFDLGFDGAPIFYSWPSQGRLSAYTVDETNAEWSVPHLKEFLEMVSSKTGAKQIHLIVHSMGGRSLSAALKEIANEQGSEAPIFKEIVLAAPDIDAEVFKRDILPRIQPIVGRITLYASSVDKALMASKMAHGNPRAGDSNSEALVVVHGMDTVDASTVDTSFLGHSYYAENRSIISDIYLLLRTGNPPNQRNLLERYRNGDKYWTFRP